MITQAQIAAVAKVIMEDTSQLTTPRECHELAEAALTAAAQVGECKTCGGLGYLVGDAEWNPYAVQCPECKAAAQVRRDDDVVVEGTKKGVNLFCKTDRNATIEHCAKRLEAFYLNSEGKIRDADDLDDYIAAIRKLKDTP